MEFIKLGVCFFMVLLSSGFDRKVFRQTLNREVFKPIEIVKLSVPAGLYFIQNNLLYFALSNLRATPYKVTYNLKILTGAVFSVVLLRQVFRSQESCANYLTFDYVLESPIVFF